MSTESDFVGSILGALVKTIKRGNNVDFDPNPELHLYLDKPQNKLTITVDYPATTDIEKIGIELLDIVKSKVLIVK